MKCKRTFLRLACHYGLPCIALFLIGCATPPHRARQYKKAFSNIEEADKARVIEGNIKMGDTREMVYIALGTPAAQTLLPTKTDHAIERWEYLGYIENDEETAEDDTLHVYHTTNDFELFNPFDSKQNQVIAVDFLKNEVVAIDSFSNKERQLKLIPGRPIVLPQSLHSPAQDEPLPTDSSTALDDPSEQPL